MRLEDFLAQNAEEKTFETGAVIFKQGDQAEAAYYIESGQVDIYKIHDDGTEAIMSTLAAGEIFGEMALLRYDSYTLNARAVSDVKLREISPTLLNAQMREAPPLIKAMIDMLLDRIHNVNEVLIDLDQAG